ncbi:5'/3'-nucleotidase SurE [Cellulomonas telluris]|uniref:5'/3'-nucleotidase SurE n=1 Tax=Cellulomonas telluris TaxID=2306636 RepID=UPI0010A9448B|nr:5'/3'-nucleotidase SurE [Cellulomonas telluris]
MRVLVTNDDGIDSPGLAALARVAVEAGHDVVVAAPASEFSGASASLLGAQEEGRLVVDRRTLPDLEDVEAWAVGAAPGLIAFVAAYDGFGPKPDLVLSGINRGPNTGHAVLHSGTVGACLTASTHDIPALAVSLTGHRPTHFASAAAYARPVLDWLVRSGEQRVLNVNVPDLPLAEVKGLRPAHLARIGAVQAQVQHEDEGFLTVTYGDVELDEDPDSDAGLVAQGWATVSQLRAPVADLDVELPELGPLA